MKAKKPPQTIRSKNSAGAKKPMPVPSRINPRALLFVGICVIAVATLFAVRQASQKADVASVSTRTEATAPPENAPMATQLETTEAVESKVPTTAAVAKPSTAYTSPVKAPTVESVKAVAAASGATARVSESTPKAPAVEPTRTTAEPEVTPKTDVQNVASVTTITGCLELDDATFWLKDSAGGDVPKSRSWKSGFLKKRPSSIQLVDGTNTLNLKNYVRQRIAATGTLVNREMRAHSLQSVAASCP